MIRPWHTWTVFGICCVVVVTAMGWISWKLIDLDRAEATAQRHAQQEENVRLALWRMESALAPLIAQEGSRPYFAYSSFYPAQGAYTRMYNAKTPGEFMLPSPLLATASPYVLVHFQIDPLGNVSSPQVPTGDAYRLARSATHLGITPERIREASSRLAAVKPLLNRQMLVKKCPIEEPELPPVAQIAQTLRTNFLDISARQMEQPLQRSMIEQQARSYQNITNIGGANSAANLDINTNGLVLLEAPTQTRPTGARLVESTFNVCQGAMQPMWLGDALVLVRRVAVNGTQYVQGCRLDWPLLREWLLSHVRDLLPEADLEPVLDTDTDTETRMLAALPLRLAPGPVAAATVPITFTTRITLGMAWMCVALAAVAIAVLLSGALTLSERRAAFVSAVTHELRTPLTTFKLYTELLGDGKVADERKRKRYIETLRCEANRLAHLVENVLAFARLERNGMTRRVESITLPDLIDRVGERLADRAGQADLNLSVEIDESLNGAKVRADSAAVEQILFNLVDNACKYARSETQPVIHIEADCDGRFSQLRVRDHGPGISRKEARRLFKPFCKSAQDAAHSAPGVGLGLTLSRRLARNMGGDLRVCNHTHDGACFILSLPSV